MRNNGVPSVLSEYEKHWNDMIANFFLPIILDVYRLLSRLTFLRSFPDLRRALILGDDVQIRFDVIQV